MIKQDNAIVSVSLAIPYVEYKNISCLIKSSCVSIIPLLDILDRVDNKIEDPESGLYHFIIATDPSKTRRGLSRKTVDETIKIGKAMGFTTFIADTTNIKSFKLFTTHFGYDAKKIITFKSETITRVGTSL